MFGVKARGHLEYRKLTNLARICAINGAEFDYNSSGKESVEVWRDVTDKRDFHAFCRSVQLALEDSHGRAVSSK